MQYSQQYSHTIIIMYYDYSEDIHTALYRAVETRAVNFSLLVFDCLP